MGDLFISFNPNTEIAGIVLSLNWLSVMRCILFLPQKYWLLPRKPIYAFNYVFSALSQELKAVLGKFVNPGTTSFFISLFIFIIFRNFLGLFPYVFTASRHLRFTLSLRLPLWLGYILLRLTSQFNRNMAHLVPEGTPGALIPLMVVIESVRLVIRPFTLAVRLAANIVAGHLLLVLLGNQGATVGGLVLVVLITALILLLTLECAVACIQSYVFTILRSLYLSEHNSLAIFKRK